MIVWKTVLVTGINLLILANVCAAEGAMGTDPLMYSGPAWSPYLVGALLGVLSWCTFYFSGSGLGASSAYATIAGMLGKAVAPKHTRSLPYYRENELRVDWGLMVLLGILIGAFFAAWTGGETTGRWLPPMWEARFGPDSEGLRFATGMSGGMCMGLGARFAGGCTSGHGISGTLQLSLSSWVSAACFFIGGIPVAMLLYRT